MEGMGGNGPVGYGETSLEGMEKQAWRLWRNKPGGHGETGLEDMEKQAWMAWRNRPGGYGEMT